ncbi:ATP-binding protein [Rhodobacter sp. CZR27]|uniref:ATP-binding protein n=1 Tax=Rhodobacter sp. CZR27 TaxID=2033869 RepID=UPI000BBE5F12|nr:HAMP domain-containing sensor histidine kinase [Rhodobacter sp. CZR27]
MRHLPLSVRVPLAAAAMMVATGLVASQQVLGRLDAEQRSRLRELVELQVTGLSVALGPSVLREDVWEVFDTLDRAGEAGGRIVLTAVADAQGRVIAASDPRRAPVGSALATLSADALPSEALVLDPAARHVRVLAPLVYQGRPIGQILIELDVSDLVAERRHARLFLLAGNALATGLIAALGLLAMRRMLRPVGTLARHMGAAEGAPQPIAEAEIPRGDPELAGLFRTFNAMSDAVRARAETERRLAERERFVSLGRLSSSLAHEINNPLGGLLNATDTIRSYADRPKVVRQSADLLDRGLRHLRDVARATLEMNRIDRQGMPLQAQDFDDLRILFAPEVARLGQRLDWAVAPGLFDPWPAAPVRQIALNLLLNASAAAGSGGSVALRVACDADLRLEVSDDGPGLSEAALCRLMTDDPLPPEGGVGLRLVRDLVRDLGGRIDHARSDGLTALAVVLPPRLPC